MRALTPLPLAVFRVFPFFGVVELAIGVVWTLAREFVARVWKMTSYSAILPSPMQLSNSTFKLPDLILTVDDGRCEEVELGE